jgi:hypothetical protein
MAWPPVLLALACSQIVTTPVAASDLEQRTIDAYDRYVEQAREAFLQRAYGEEWTSMTSPSRPAPVRAIGRGEPSPSGRIVKVPNGLVHHWAGGTFIAGVDLRRVLDVAHGYDHYAGIYRSVTASRLLARDGDTFHVFARLKEDAGIASTVLDVRTVVTYVQGARCAYSIGVAKEIREVKNAGASNERLLPPGHGSGYLWRANTFTRFVQLDDGVYVELETIGLSRRFPALFAWIVEPVARRLGRSSVERTLAEFRAAVLAKEL